MDMLYIKLQKIRVVPLLFLGEKSITSLYFFILGYSDKAFEIDSNYKDCLEGFTEFVQKKCKDRYQVHSWVSLVKKKSSNEEEAFDYFFSLLKEHIKGKRQSDGTAYDFNAEEWYKKRREAQKASVDALFKNNETGDNNDTDN